MPNGGGGVQITGGFNNTIGGTLAAAGNIISGNSGPGGSISGSTATGNLIAANAIGLDATGTFLLPNTGDGVYLTGAGEYDRRPLDCRSATASAAAATSAARPIPPRTVLSITAGSMGNLVASNIIAENTAGGVHISGSANNTIGGASAGNVLSQNGDR